MPRTKQALKTRSKAHKKQAMKVRLRKNKLKGKKRAALTRTRKKSGGKKK